MARFRETLWFKQGMLDAELPEQADLLPIEDRYLDDGSLTTEDVTRFSLEIKSVSRRAKPHGDGPRRRS
jgi:hypothetical protein